jgi:hypothetical protein
VLDSAIRRATSRKYCRPRRAFVMVTFASFWQAMSRIGAPWNSISTRSRKIASQSLGQMRFAKFVRLASFRKSAVDTLAIS